VELLTWINLCADELDEKPVSMHQFSQETGKEERTFKYSFIFQVHLHYGLHLNFGLALAQLAAGGIDREYAAIPIAGADSAAYLGDGAASAAAPGHRRRHPPA